ncbi:hypothetical protein E1B28_005995 [Marasmius oreades]|uniref:Uncharacterized protein n=1 Tax=Marasmius oreades TaxID=181124 RepID=A0A9P7S4N6_9AGAR|nr:uncharacterized protein E1B28_005995 [Marasmius oreades]KAG7095220.1 hypothetical protein E1B28_005995 [Marasmius oreades]
MTATALAIALRPVADQFTFLTTTKVHSTLFPYPWASTLHAARISLMYQGNMKKAGQEKAIGWKAYLVGYLVMSWGGMLISHFLLNLPPPPLYSIHPYINYLGVHLLLTLAVSSYPTILSPQNLPIYDLVLFPLDAVLRVNAITSSLTVLSSNVSVNPVLVNSPLFHLIIGAVASAGGGVSAGTFSLWTSQWAFSTPVFLRSTAGWIATLDLWGGSVVALVYGLSTSHPAFESLRLSFTVIPPLSPLGAKALCTIVLGGLFGYRVVTAIPASAPQKVEGLKEDRDKGKAKTQ